MNWVAILVLCCSVTLKVLQRCSRQKVDVLHGRSTLLHFLALTQILFHCIAEFSDVMQLYISQIKGMQAAYQSVVLHSLAFYQSQFQYWMCLMLHSHLDYTALYTLQCFAANHAETNGLGL